MMISSIFSFFKIFVFFFFLYVGSCSSIRVCKPVSCSEMGPPIRFPFWLKGMQSDLCGHPGFDLSCSDQGQTILNLPASGDFEVNRIDYTAQAVYINDPELCLPKRISKFDTNGSKFRAAMGNKNYTFYSCSSDWISYMGPDRIIPLFCLGNRNYTVLATDSDTPSRDLPPSCILMPNVSVPLRWSFNQYWSTEVFSEDIELIWSEPNCRNCEFQSQFCGFRNSSSLEVACTDPPRSKGLPRSAKYGVIIGVGIPGLVCMIGLACYSCNRLRNYAVHRHSDWNTTDQSTTTVINPQRSISMTGLDGPTIESYPKTVIGESRRFPKPSDGTCPICLSDYQPKESLRTIPECNHYFHADCIDEWLKLNGTCPLCRNALESSTMTPCSSVSSIFSSSTSTA